MDAKLIKSSFFGALAALVAALISLTVFSFIALKLDDPDKAIGAFALASLLIGASAAGLFSAVLYREKPSAPSIIAGIIYLLLVLAISLVFRDKGERLSFAQFGLRALFSLLSSFLCGFAANPGAKKKRRVRSRRRAYKRGRT